MYNYTVNATDTKYILSANRIKYIVSANKKYISNANYVKYNVVSLNDKKCIFSVPVMWLSLPIKKYIYLVSKKIRF
jgi:hypothetical protein